MQQCYYATDNPPYDSYVEFVQRSLNQLRFSLHLNIPAVNPVDGKYGRQTAEVVRSFQKVCQLEQDGIWGPQSRQALAQKLREQPQTRSESVRANSWAFENIPRLISQLCSCITTISNAAVREIERVATHGRALSSRDVQMIYNRCLYANPDLDNIQNLIRQLWEHQDIQTYLEQQARSKQFIRMTPKGKLNKKDVLRNLNAGFAHLKSLNNQSIIREARQAFQTALDRYLNHMRSADFINCIQQQVNRIPRVGSRVNVGRIIRPLAFMPLFMDIIAMPVFAINGLPLDDLIDKTYNDIFQFIDGVIISLIAVQVVALVGLTGGWAIVITLLICIILGIFVSVFFPDNSFTQWMFTETNQIMHSSVFCGAVRTSFI